ncbi:MAG: protein kinase [Thermoleophilaceae bacterium]|nr:protein kinase [Thermoleophilaceae bacterium]
MRTVGGYRIVEPVSRGAMGAVFRARDGAGRDVALKRLTEGPRERFEIEARLLSRLRHPRVVEVLGHVHDDGSDYLVMELVEGKDLGRLVKEEGDPGLGVERALAYGGQACEALQYVHEQQIVHRDVKPQNLLLSPDRGVVLVDFGIARELYGDSSGTRGVGTPLYMAPEVLVGESVSPRSDVFGLAATVWTLIAGRPPGYNDATVLSELVPGVTPALEQTLRRGLDLHSERRFGSAAAFAAALGAPQEAIAGESLALSLRGPSEHRALVEAIVRTAAGVFEAAAASLALVEPTTGELVYQASWGAGAAEIVGVRLEPGRGIAGAAVASREPVVVSNCRADDRFAAQIASGTGYVPNTMLVVPLERRGKVIGALSILDRRDGGRYRESDVPRARLFGELAVAAIPAAPPPNTSGRR